MQISVDAWGAPLAAFLLCWLTLAWLLRRGGRLPMDHPNARSLHETPTPRIGGLGVMSGVAVASLWLGDSDLLPVVLGALALAAVFGLPAEGWLARAVPAAILLLGAIPVGTLAFPALLPWLPTRAFSVKGAVLGAAWAASCAVLFRMPVMTAASGMLVAAPVVAFLGMNFTGASTFTCQPGALLEVEKGFWPMVLSLIAGLAAGGAARIFGA